MPTKARKQVARNAKCAPNEGSSDPELTFPWMLAARRQAAGWLCPCSSIERKPGLTIITACTDRGHIVHNKWKHHGNVTEIPEVLNRKVQIYCYFQFQLSDVRKTWKGKARLLRARKEISSRLLWLSTTSTNLDHFVLNSGANIFEGSLRLELPTELKMLFFCPPWLPNLSTLCLSDHAGDNPQLLSPLIKVFERSSYVRSYPHPQTSFFLDKNTILCLMFE